MCRCQWSLPMPMPPGLAEELPIANLMSARIVLGPPRLFARRSRPSGQHKLLVCLCRLQFSHSEVLVVEDANRLDDVGDRYPPVADEEQVLSFLEIRRRGEVI